MDFIKSILCFVGNIINKKGAAKKPHLMNC